MALPRGAMGLSAVCDLVLPDHTHLLFLKPSRQKRQVKVKNFENCETKNILDRLISNNDRGFIVEHCKTEQLKHSFFARTVV